MARTNNRRRKAGESRSRTSDALQPRRGEQPSESFDANTHSLGRGIICDTDPRGYAMPRGMDPQRIVLDASEGFIPLWAKDSTLRWRFRERSMDYFADPAAAKAEIRNLVAEALLQWGSAAPVTFKEDADVWDFEIVMRHADDCDPGGGCVLASAFFPDTGRHQLDLYPKMFAQSRKEQVETFIHEFGHVFGLRHFFALVSETAWPAEIFGTHSKFSIMNYGVLSELTSADKDDLTRLYQLVWSGALTHINGTPIRLVKPYHTLAFFSDGVIDGGAIPSPFLPRTGAIERPTAASPLPLTSIPLQQQTRAAYLAGY